jgi:hypothetical protein
VVAEDNQQVADGAASYFDAASTEPLHPVARATLLAALE